MPAEDTSFARLVSVACHDLRTPLATVLGFARTLPRMEGVDDQMRRYLEMIAAASLQLDELLEDLAQAARIEAGRWEPLLREVDSLALTRAAAEELGEKAGVSGAGAVVAVDEDATRRALYLLARCVQRHGGLERVEIVVSGPRVSVSPLVPEAAPVVLAEDLKDLGAAVGKRTVEALGGSLSVDDERLLVSLPPASESV
jgi:signal transduction histidine kinase